MGDNTYDTKRIIQESESSNALYDVCRDGLGLYMAIHNQASDSDRDNAETEYVHAHHIHK
jgi:hypothetical protein